MAGLEIKNTIITEKKAAKVYKLIRKGECNEIWLKNCTADSDISCWFYNAPPLKYLLLDNNRSIKTCASGLKIPTSFPIKELTICNGVLTEKLIQHLTHVLSMFKTKSLVLYDIHKDETSHNDTICVKHILSGTSASHIILENMDADVVGDLLQGFTQAFTTKWVGIGKHIEMSTIPTGLQQLLLNDKSKELTVIFQGIHPIHFFAQLLHVLSKRRRSNQHINIEFVDVKLPADVPQIDVCLPDVFHCDNLSVKFKGDFCYEEIVAKFAQNKDAAYLVLPCLPRRTDRNIFFGKYPNITNITVSNSYTQPFSQDTECPQLRVLAIKNTPLTIIPLCVLLTRLDITQYTFCVNLENLKYSKALEYINIDVQMTCPESTSQLASYLASDSSQCLSTFQFNALKIRSSEINVIFVGITNCLALRHIKVTYTTLDDHYVEALMFSISNFLENNKFLETLEIPLAFRTNDLDALHNSKVTNLTCFALENRQTASNIMAILKRNTDNQTSLTNSMLTKCLAMISRDPIGRSSEHRNALSSMWGDLLGRWST